MRTRERIFWTGMFFVASVVGCNDVTTPEETTPIIPTPTLTPTPEIDSTITPNPTSTRIPAPTPISSTPMSPIKERVTHTQQLLEIRTNDMEPLSVPWNLLDLIDPINVMRWEEIILANAERFDIPPEVIAAVIDTESHGRTDGEWAELEGDGVGLMGVMPQELGFPNRPTREELFDPETNIAYGSAILWEIYMSEDMGNGSWYDTLLWYNAGLEERLHFAENYAEAIYDKLNWIPSHELEQYAPLSR